MTYEMLRTFLILDKICSGLGAAAACFLIYRYYIRRHTDKRTKLILIVICMLTSLGNYGYYWVNTNRFSKGFVPLFGLTSMMRSIIMGSIYIAGISGILLLLLWLLENIKEHFFEKQRLWMIICTVLTLAMLVIHLIFILIFISKIPGMGIVRNGYIVNVLMYAAFSVLVFAAAMRDYTMLQDKA